MIALAGGYILYSLFAPEPVVYSSEIKQGSQMAEDIESLRQRHGALPSALRGIGVSDRDQDRFFYQRCDANHYILWFGTMLGESMIYDSGTQRWSEAGSGCAK
jgi:hypothetical protein